MATTCRGSLTILYGSQTGCAEEVANGLANEALRRRYRPVCLSLDAYDVRKLPTERFLVVVVSTTGEGEVPDGMRPFWQFLLRRDLPAGSLGGVIHACFGLGDSSYPKFNFAAKRLHRRLEQLGSTAIVPLGLGDDQDARGTDHALSPWQDALWPALDAQMPLPAGLTPLPVDACPAARYVFTILELFRDHLDIFGVPRRPFFALLAHFAADPMHAERLAEFGSVSGAGGLAEYAARPRRTYAEVLGDFRSARPPDVSYYLDLIPPLRARYFSIASSPLAHPNEVHITVAVVKYATMLTAPREGVCSNYLASLRPAEKNDEASGHDRGSSGSSASGAGDGDHDDAILVWLRAGCLRMPADPSAPILMIGPGTGVAPFRAFVQQRRAQRHASIGTVGDAVLYFGCRAKDVDYLYSDEWRAALADGALSALHVAFSREAGSASKVYVQHKMVELHAAKELWGLLSHPACHVYIAGASGGMPRAVRKAIELVAREIGGLTESEAAELPKRLDASKRLQCETW